MAKLALIGGTGVYDPDLLDSVTEETVSTPYGVVDISIGTLQGLRLSLCKGMAAVIPYLPQNQLPGQYLGPKGAWCN